MPLQIGITCDVKEDWQFAEGDPLDANAEFDKPETIKLISRALGSGGHRVKVIGNVRNLVRNIDCLDVDLVFNICEGITGRNRESQVPVLLDTFGIPYTGSDGLTLGITLDKGMAKKCFLADGIPTPAFFVAETPADVVTRKPDLTYPLFVKTNWEGTSKGLSLHSRVASYEELQRQVEFITATYRQPALVEQFVRGTEYTVAVMGNGDPQAMPVVQVTIDGNAELGDQFYTYELVSSPDLRYRCPAPISEELNRELQRLAKAAYRSVGCRDFGRVDFRVDETGQPYVLEINPLPALESEDVFNIFPQVMGTTYEAVILDIVNYAAARYPALKEKTATTDTLVERA